jgi:hypothetical protein
MNLPVIIEVFKTNVDDKEDAIRIVRLLGEHYPACRINFDLQDCDRILRLEGLDFEPEKVVNLVKQTGFNCEALE